MQKINELFDLTKTIAAPLFEGKNNVWEVLPEIRNFIIKLGATLPSDEFDHPSETVWIAKDAKVFSSAYIGPYCIIDHGASVKQCAFIRENAIVGKNATVGNSCEIKNAILFDNAQAPHFNYVGDSILGFKSHLGGGAITSNLKSDGSNVVIHDSDKEYETGLRKIGAILGDYVEVGCNSVLNPGTIVGCGSRIYPLSCVRGVVPAKHIYKDKKNIVAIREN